ncbi:CAP domain-containing protein, partial [Gorgonomyces haynaldii]
YYDDCVAIHNQYRAQWGLPAVSYNSQLAASAYNWAKQLSDSGSFYHSGGNYGENLYSGTIATCRAAIDMWAAEKSNYHCEPIGSGSFSSYGHYTQMASPFNSVGCGIYGHVVACHY